MSRYTQLKIQRVLFKVNSHKLFTKVFEVMVVVNISLTFFYLFLGLVIAFNSWLCWPTIAISQPLKVVSPETWKFVKLATFTT